MKDTISFIRENLTEAEIWGQLAEEAAELAQAALKMQRFYLGNNIPRKDVETCMASVIEEHGDIEMCFEALDWNDGALRKLGMEVKWNRWANHISSIIKERGGNKC